ncbi:DUF6161 domain-containing protein [Idiomarina abyssalis]|uniref:DUF6161 domain-containing protein n=1 Tax=Idiomarina abyssalis TaxID=86102 RepID=UPI003A91E95B
MTDKINFSIQDAFGKTFDFSTLSHLKKFLHKELEFWSEQKAQLGTEAKNISFVDGANQFSSFINTLKTIEAENDLTEEDWAAKLQSLKQNHLRGIEQQWLWSDHHFITAYIECAKAHGALGARAFYEYANQSPINNLNRCEALAGAIAAFEFFDAPDAHTKRKTGEKVSLTSLRNSFLEYQGELFSDFSTFKEKQATWDKLSRKKQIRRYRAQKQIGQKLLSDASDEFKSRMSQWESDISNLEQVYEDKLRLEKPARYWDKAAKKFRLQGVVTTVVLLALVSLGIIKISSIVEVWMLRGETPLSLASLQGAVLFGSLAAIFAFGVRVLSRMAFSSFHLMRDAEERHQLTHLYLSLTNETESDERAREIILQALFSRSETGLLANENGPSMPGLSDLARKVSRNSSGNS